MDKLNIILNGKTVRGIPGETILQLASRQGIKIPTLCHDKRLKPYSSCFVCVVEVAGKGTQPSCSTEITEGMQINTNNSTVFDARKMALDLLLSNHYADCVAPCKETCPAGVDVQGYISLIEKNQYNDAVALIKEDNPLPAICGRVCVRPCEAACRRNLLDEGNAVGIDYLKRFAADQDLLHSEHYTPELAKPTGKKVAIIGAGPGGLSAAYWLQQKGHQCDVFEANEHPGGWLRYGIPEYRLPNDLLDKEIETITELGSNIFMKQNFGENLSYKKIKKEYDATILTIGSQRGTLLRAEGEEADGVFSGIDFLRNMEMTGQKYDFSGKTIVTVGGGNTAMDCCRTAIRCGAERSIIVYRRTEKEMPANPIEIHESKAENVEYMLLTNPVKVNSDEAGKVKSMTLIKMELGAPDASGRRRPVPVEGSEYELECDYILAAIGQKTDVNFMDDINANSDEGKLELNRWGDIDANEKTLQTGIKSVFAAGDGVTGPATIIEAIAQAKTAAHSVDMFLRGEEPMPIPKPFVSRKDHFKNQVSEDYVGRYQNQMRHEMPVLPENDRKHFKEVELGYESEQIAVEEAHRCLECGCSEFFDCDLQKFSTEYHVEQEKFGGEFQERPIDFSHPYIEIDNNKCILCSRCVRICKEVVGASALGLVDRGFDTYVAPAMGDSLVNSTCESCGLCISACPTGAITENVKFKPGPVKTDSIVTISPFGSIGESIRLEHKNGFVFRVNGTEGMINPLGNIDRYAKFAYNFINKSERITKPLIRRKGKLVEAEWNEIKHYLQEKLEFDKPTALFAGGRLTNEELFALKSLSAQTSMIKHSGSFHLLHMGEGHLNASEMNMPFDQFDKVEQVLLMHPQINMDDATLGFMINEAQTQHDAEMILITDQENPKLEHKVNRVIRIASYDALLKAMNHYLLSHNLQNNMFLSHHCDGLEAYKTDLLKVDFAKLCKNAGVSVDIVSELVKSFNLTQHAVLVTSERYLNDAALVESRNLCLLSGKLGKTASGLVNVKEKNNSQGVLDVGLVSDSREVHDAFYRKAMKQLLIFGEDPVGTAKNKAKVQQSLKSADVLLVQDYFLTETAEMADVVLPASLPFEIGGSFTNTQKMIQQFDAGLKSNLSKNALQQIAFLGNLFSPDKPEIPDTVHTLNEQMFPEMKSKADAYKILISNNLSLPEFYHAADSVIKAFDTEFKTAFH
ncbi:MAG: FAD-dependent oxidoreductase [Bacteroidales bacterium]|jgi:formate dehydrogenase major subunit|nr:FAD-dependent oxidoreductase [Bacteroidales bacterium]